MKNESCSKANSSEDLNSKIKLKKHDFISLKTDEIIVSDVSKQNLNLIDYPKKKVNEFWTSKQRKNSSLHEISYRACFKAEIPRFFIEKFTVPGDLVYDPFGGRGTTCLEAALLGRKIINNDINCLSTILLKPRLDIPNLIDLKKRLDSIPILDLKSDIDLSMFYHKQTLKEILSIKFYLSNKENDDLDLWIRLVASSRLSGHSRGFFSVYTLPPNQAVLPKRQIKINDKFNQIPEYRNTKELIIKKTKSLLRNLSVSEINFLNEASKTALFLNNDASHTPEIMDKSVSLIVTSPPFLDVIDYSSDNWLRLWFNNISFDLTKSKLTQIKSKDAWSNKMLLCLKEFKRILKDGGRIAFEVGEVKNGTVFLEDEIVKISSSAGLEVEEILINLQKFTKTANIWGVLNNKNGTNTNRIVVLKKREKIMENDDLKEVLFRMLKPLKNVSLETVIEGTTTYKILPFDKKSEEDFLKILTESILEAAQKFNLQKKTTKDFARANEVGMHIENILLNVLKSKSTDLVAQTPLTKSGKKKSSGYPDYEINFANKWFYLECKTYEEKNWDSKLRTFYFSPSDNPKITKNAPHLLVAYQVQLSKDNESIYHISRYRLIDLKNLKVNVKYEFNASNFDMYSNNENIVFEDEVQIFTKNDFLDNDGIDEKSIY